MNDVSHEFESYVVSFKFLESLSVSGSWAVHGSGQLAHKTEYANSSFNYCFLICYELSNFGLFIWNIDQ